MPARRAQKALNWEVDCRVGAKLSGEAGFIVRLVEEFYIRNWSFATFKSLAVWIVAFGYRRQFAPVWRAPLIGWIKPSNRRPVNSVFGS